jgi:hypothetical protein
MKFSAVLPTLIFSIIVGACSLSAEHLLTVNTSIDIIVEGLVENDIAEIRIVPDTEKTASDVQTAGITLPVLSLSNEFKRISLIAIPLGSYQLTISTPASYFREPQAYLFQVQGSSVVNRLDSPLPFTLIPVSPQDLPPCRDVAAMPAYPPPSLEPTGDIPSDELDIICRAEGIIDISSPPKLPEQ